MNTDIHTRLLSLIKDKSLNAAQFADEIGVQRSSISHILSGRNKPSIDFLEKLITRYKDIDIHWLLSGSTSQSQNLFSNIQEDARVSIVNSNIPNQELSLFDSPKNQTIQNIPTKTIEKIVTFYSDKTFKEYYPEK